METISQVSEKVWLYFNPYMYHIINIKNISFLLPILGNAQIKLENNNKNKRGKKFILQIYAEFLNLSFSKLLIKAKADEIHLLQHINGWTYKTGEGRTWKPYTQWYT